MNPSLDVKDALFNVSGSGMGTTNEHPIENNYGYSTNIMEV